MDLFAVQAFVDAGTYRSEATFRAAMERLADRAVELRRRDANGAFRDPAILVFPEHIGTFLALAPLGRLGAWLPSSDLAAAMAVGLRPRRFWQAARHVRPITLAALLALSPEVRAVWERTFADLAWKTRATVVAGSALVADPPGSDRVYNLSATFGPDGERIGVTRKVNLVPALEDVLGLGRGEASAVAPVATPAGPLGTLICYDGFAVPHTRTEPEWCRIGVELAARGARIVAQPAANPWAWDARWVHAPTGSSLLRREQWRSEGLETQLREMEGVRYAITAHLVGRVLDQRFEGRSAILRRDPDGSVHVVAEARRAQIDPASAEVVHARVDVDWTEDAGC